MKENINFDKVADIYDFYVNLNFDVPFFLKETQGYEEEILELMCGTGRVSIPLLDSGRRMTCVDYSKGMLNAFEKKIKGKNYRVNLVHADVTNMALERIFGMILLPFHSLTEILSTEMQTKALQCISSHLEKNGIFILTLQNPVKRLKSADGVQRVMGKFSAGDGKQLVVSYMNKYNQSDGIVSGYQLYEIFDESNALIEKRFLEINFKPIKDSEIREMIKTTGLEILEVFGDYSYARFNESDSDFMIYCMSKR